MLLEKTLPGKMEYRILLREKRRQGNSALALHLTAAMMLFVIGLVCAVFGRYVRAWPEVAKELPLAFLSVLCILLSIVIGTIAVLQRKNVQAGKGFWGLVIVEVVTLETAAVLCYKYSLMLPAILLTALSAIVVAAAIYRRKEGANPPSAVVTEEGIKLAGKKIPWREIDKVMLRHGNLTIEATRNRLYQREFLSHDLDAPLFEGYCNAMVEKAMPEREKEW